MDLFFVFSLNGQKFRFCQGRTETNIPPEGSNFSVQGEGQQRHWVVNYELRLTSTEPRVMISIGVNLPL